MKDRNLAIKKVQAFAENPEIIKEPTMGEMADLVVLVLNAVDEIDGLIKAGRLDGKTPESDKDYMSYETAQGLLRTEIQNFLNRGESVLSETATELEKRVQQAIKNIRNGENGIVTDKDIARASQMALEMIELPDFDSLVDEKITANPIAIRDGLESIVEEESKLKIEAISNLRKELNELKSLSGNTTVAGVRLLRYLADVNIEGITNGQTIVWNATSGRFEPGSAGGGSVSDTAYGGSWNGVTDVAPSKNAVYDKIESLVLGAGTGDVVGPASAVNNNFAAFDLTTGKLIKDSGVSASSFATALGADDNYVTDAEKVKLSNLSGTNTGDQTSIVGITGTKAQFDTAVTDGNFMYVGDAPTAHTHPASAITDFDTEVSNNTDVAANTAARHAAVTVTDSAEINFTLTGQDLTGSLIADSVDFTKLNNINTNRILGRSTAGTGNIEELNVTAVPALIGLGTSDSPQFTGVNIGHATDTTISRVSAGVIAVEGNNIVTANMAASAANINTGTSTTVFNTPDALAGSNFGIRYAAVSLNGTTALTTAEKAYFRIPAALTGMNLVSVAATVGTGAAGSSSSGTPTFTVKNITQSSVNMLSTNLTVDASEYTSATAATAAVIDTANDDVATDDLIEIAVTTSGTGVTYATITLGFQLP